MIYLLLNKKYLKLNIPKKEGYQFDSKGIIDNNPDVKEGKCIFPFVYKGKQYFDCFKNERGEPICATEISNESQRELIKFGYCFDNQCKGSTESNIIASTIDSSGKDFSDKKGYKAGKCCFPFTLPKKKIKVKHMECVGDKTSKSENKICATSTDENNKLLTKGFCPEEPKTEFVLDESKWKGPPDGVLHSKNKKIPAVLKDKGKRWSTDDFKTAADKCGTEKMCKGITLRKKSGKR